MKDATLAQRNQILNLILQKEVSAERLQALITSGLLSDLLDANVSVVDRKKFRQAIGLEGGSQSSSFVVDYGKSLKDSIATGKYDYANPNITEEHFPPAEHEQSKKEQSFALYHFGKETESAWVIAQMEKDGKRPATIRELLAFGETNPEIQRQFPIVALGSVWVYRRGDRGVAYLYGYVAERSLDLHWYDYRWRDRCRFLAVSK